MIKTYQQRLSAIIKIAIPVSLGQLGHVMANVVDNIMLGKFSITAASSATFALGVFFPIFLLNLGYSMGITPLISNKLGEKDTSNLKDIAANGFWANITIGVLSAILGFIIANFLDQMGQPKSIIPEAISYFKILSISIIPVMIFQSAKQFAEAFSDTKVAMIISLVGNALNVVLNIPLIFGWDGVITPMGVTGAGIATLISRVIMAVAMVIYVLSYADCRQNFSIQRKHLQKKVLKFITKMSLPIGFQYMLEVSTFAIATIFVGWWSEEMLFAHQIAFNVASITFIIATGFGAAASVRVGYFWGAKDLSMVKNSFHLLIIIVITYMLVCIFFILTFRHIIPTLYTDNQVVIDAVSSALVVATLFQLSDGIQLICAGALRGINDVQVPTYITFFSYWVVSLPTGYYLAFVRGIGLNGIWYGFVVGLSISAILLWLRFRYKITHQ